MSHSKNKTKPISGQNLALVAVAFFHLAGACFLTFGKGFFYQLALDLVPINLILTCLISVKFHDAFNGKFFKFLIIAFCIGLGSEIFGIQTGILFGFYEYGKALGLQIFHTPILIGLNWFLICFGVGSLMGPLAISKMVKWLISIILLIIFDYFMEPVAIKNDFWNWVNGSIPTSNYVGWSIVSAIIMGFYYLFIPKTKNTVSGKIWIIQFLFFMLQNLI